MKGINHFGPPSAWLICLAVMQVWLPCFAAEQRNSNCDPGLQPAGGSEVGYAARGDRCEGLYVQEVSGGTLEVVSLTGSFKAYKFAKDMPVFLEWATVGD